MGIRTVRSMHMKTIRIAVVVLALVLAACGAGSTEDTGPVEEPVAGDAGEVSATTESSVDPVTETTAAGSGEDEPETLAAYLGYDLDDPDASAARAMEEQRRVEENIARCMAEEGFEYVPAVRPMSSSSFAFDEEEFARERGFGITTWYGQEDPFGFEDNDWVDPNDAILEALSESEREAYHETLYGPGAYHSGSPGESIVEIVDSGEGCRQRAYEEVYGARDEVWEQLGPKFEELTQRLFADPRFQEASDRWAVCMADRGYPYGSIEQMYEEVYQDFQSRLDEIIGEGGGFVNPFEGWTEEEIEAFLAERSEEEISDFYDQAQQQGMQDIDQEALAALQQEERDLAVAAFECQQELEDVLDELRQEYEGRFIRENRDLLEQIRP